MKPLNHLTVGICLVAGNPVFASDITGNFGSLSGTDVEISADLGTQADINLFHRCKGFNLYTGDRVTFSGPETVHNVISLVTGGTVSFIDGTLRCTIPGADLYFLNPAGWIFGENASLDSTGSMFVSTGEQLIFDDNTVLDVSEENPSTFTSAPPCDFGFLNDSPADITVRGSQFSVGTGKTLSFSGGDISLQDIGFFAPDGRIDITAAGKLHMTSDGDLHTVSHPAYSGEIANLDVSGTQGGGVFIQAGRFFASGIQITSQVLADEPSSQGTIHEIRIRADESIDFESVEISTATDLNATGQAGNIDLKAPTIDMRNDSRIQSITTSVTGADAGNIEISADELNIQSSTINAGTSGRNNAHSGSIDIITGTLSLSDEAEITSASEGVGNAGAIHIQTDDLRLESNSHISTSADYTRSDDLQLEINDTLYVSDSSITASAHGADPQYAGGNIYIGIPELIAMNRTIIKTTGYYGGGGNILLESKNLLASADTVLDTRSTFGADGEVTVQALNADLSDVLFTPPDLLQPRFQQRCTTHDGTTSTLALSLPYEILPPTPWGRQSYLSVPADLPDGLSTPESFVQGHYQQTIDELKNTQDLDRLLYLAAAYRYTGQAGKALQTLDSVLEMAREAQDAPRQIAALVQQSIVWQFRSSGEVDFYRRLGKSADKLKQAIQLTVHIDNPNLSAAVALQLGNLLSAYQPSSDALAVYQELTADAAHLRLVKLGKLPDEKKLLHTRNYDEFEQTRLKAQALLYQLARSAGNPLQARIATVNLLWSLPPEKAKHFAKVLLAQAGPGTSAQAIAADLALIALLNAAPEAVSEAQLAGLIKAAEQLHNPGLAALGRYFFGLHALHRQNFSVAQQHFLQAIGEADSALRYPLLVRLAELASAIGQSEQAREYYRQAFSELGLGADRNTPRPELWPVLMADAFAQGRSLFEDLQQDYHRYIGLLLEQATPENIRLAIQAAEQLKQFELTNYFQDECLAARKQDYLDLASLPARTVVVYPLLLQPNPVLLVALPNGEAAYFPVEMETSILAARVNRLIHLLDERQPHQKEAQSLYAHLLAPLEQFEMDTLIVIPDDILRRLPFSALHDGRDYVLFKPYSVTVSPSANLINLAHAPDERPNMFLGGLSEGVEGFSPLTQVDTELKNIYQNAFYPSTEPVINQAFKQETLDSMLPGHQIVHLATHGEFRRYFRKSFLLAYDMPLSMDHLGYLMRHTAAKPLELLTLSACEAALDDNAQATLGLAGLAVKTGAKSALATLWKVDDTAAAELMPKFYQYWQNHPKAKALQLAQRDLQGQTEFSEPGAWAGFVLIGNWL